MIDEKQKLCRENIVWNKITKKNGKMFSQDFFFVFLLIEIISLIFNEIFGMQHMDKRRKRNKNGRKLRSEEKKEIFSFAFFFSHVEEVRTTKKRRILMNIKYCILYGRTQCTDRTARSVIRNDIFCRLLLLCAVRCVLYSQSTFRCFPVFIAWS